MSTSSESLLSSAPPSPGISTTTTTASLQDSMRTQFTTTTPYPEPQGHGEESYDSFESVPPVPSVPQHHLHQFSAEGSGVLDAYGYVSGAVTSGLEYAGWVASALVGSLRSTLPDNLHESVVTSWLVATLSVVVTLVLLFLFVAFGWWIVWTCFLSRFKFVRELLLGSSTTSTRTNDGQSKDPGIARPSSPEKPRHARNTKATQRRRKGRLEQDDRSAYQENAREDES